MARTVDVSDLLTCGALHVVGGRDLATGVDCLWAALEVQRRRGLVVPPEADLSPVGPDSAAVLDDYLARAGYYWPRTDPSDGLLGDVRVYQGGSGRPHAVTVVNEGQRMGLSCSTVRGLHLVRYVLLGTPSSTHRYRPPPTTP